NLTIRSTGQGQKVQYRGGGLAKGAFFTRVCGLVVVEEQTLVLSADLFLQVYDGLDELPGPSTKHHHCGPSTPWQDCVHGHARDGNERPTTERLPQERSSSR